MGILGHTGPVSSWGAQSGVRSKDSNSKSFIIRRDCICPQVKQRAVEQIFFPVADHREGGRLEMRSTGSSVSSDEECVGTVGSSEESERHGTNFLKGLSLLYLVFTWNEGIERIKNAPTSEFDECVALCFLLWTNAENKSEVSHWTN